MNRCLHSHSHSLRHPLSDSFWSQIHHHRHHPLQLLSNHYSHFPFSNPQININPTPTTCTQLSFHTHIASEDDRRLVCGDPSSGVLGSASDPVRASSKKLESVHRDHGGTL
ncbi:hypothetical protein ACSBR2_014388 [Camellia fascicularis]